MRRSFAALRGAKGRGWYNAFKEDPEAFEKFTIPTAFDWSKEIEIPKDLAIHKRFPPSSDKIQFTSNRPVVFFEIASGSENMGRIEFELARDAAPRTVENFCLLATGLGTSGKTYKGTSIHTVAKGLALMAGDVEKDDGTGNLSAYQESRYLPDENFIIPHSSRGLLSMASVGVNTVGSQFYVSFTPTRYMNGLCVVFGRMIKGEEVLDKIEKVYTFRNVPANTIVITDCGIVKY